MYVMVMNKWKLNATVIYMYKRPLQSDTCKVCTEFSPFLTLSSLAEPEKCRPLL